jgi:hypothetical protein
MDLSAYDSPQPLRRLLQDLLSEQESERLRELQFADFLLEQRALPPAAVETAQDEQEELLEEIRRRAMELLSAGTLIVRGWLEGAQDREPTEVFYSILSNGYINVLDNRIFVDGKRYIGCTVTRRAPEHTVNPGSGGRPMDPKLKAACDEAIPRVQAGEKKDVVALEVAQKYGVSHETLRTYLKPSRTPKSVKP